MRLEGMADGRGGDASGQGQGRKAWSLALVVRSEFVVGGGLRCVLDFQGSPFRGWLVACGRSCGVDRSHGCCSVQAYLDAGFRWSITICIHALGNGLGFWECTLGAEVVVHVMCSVQPGALGLQAAVTTSWSKQSGQTVLVKAFVMVQLLAAASGRVRRRYSVISGHSSVSDLRTHNMLTGAQTGISAGRGGAADWTEVSRCRAGKGAAVPAW